ncbi:biopolymer transporter ExbD [uncultured Algibacter sp.]|uniref:ExbD/TolR family protein n=1 Tax=uncultured Algibacter sp. TaxID=298659 RepID=UPI002620F9CA|nr:biopolymer transporter ExbD [uncultured Algibacter sp.]
MRRSNFIPEVNAGSMADIAFLLLIFFLVTAVIPKDKGINRRLSKLCPPGQICETNINERNILRIVINNNDEIMVNGNVTTVDKLKNITKDFLDNNGDGSCNYCQGQNLKIASDNPKEAVISLQNDKQTSYNQFIKVQDELTKAYYELRTRYSKSIFKKSITDLSKEEMQILKDAYPFILSEAETK